MRTHINAVLCIALVITLGGCGSTIEPPGRIDNQPAGVNDVLETGMAAADSATENTAADESSVNDSGTENTSVNDSGTENTSVSPADQNADTPVDADTVDIDLTALSSTMVYSEVYNMIYSPEAYVGKTVKMDGQFNYYHDVPTDSYYYACIIKDATACCSQGIEFVAVGDYDSPDDYPEPGTEITVVGVFDTYMDGEYRYCTLRDASFTVQPRP